MDMDPAGDQACEADLDLQEIGQWTEDKHEILRKYAEPYSRILSNQQGPVGRSRRFRHLYVDAFAGPSQYRSRETQEIVAGSPRIALSIQPPFDEYHFIDLDPGHVANLRQLAEGRSDVTVYEGDCNDILVSQIVPKVRREDYRRALCILDPYGMSLRWDTIAALGATQTIEVLINFPTMDINRNALRKSATIVTEAQAQRMDAVWGDDSWRSIFFEARQLDLFGTAHPLKTASNEAVVQAFAERLRDVGGFQHIANPVPMKNSSNAVLYYLCFASPNATGARIMNDIFGAYRKRRG